MTASVALKAEARAKAGKGVARTLRREEKVPAIIYGNGQTPVQIAVERKPLELVYLKGKFENTLVDITVDGKTYHTIPKDLQVHPLTDRLEHVDFLKVDDNSRIKVWVHVEFLNRDKCPGIKMGGVLNIVRHEVELYCTPKTIPTKLVADLDGLGIGDSVHINSIKLPEGVSATIKRNFTVATIAGRMKEEDLNAPVVGAPMPGAEEAEGAEGAAAPAAAKAGEKAPAAKAGDKPAADKGKDKK